MVSGYGQGVHIPVTKTNRNLPGGLYGVYMDGHAVRVGDADQFLHGFHGADLVVGQHGGDHRGTFTGLAVELAFKCVEIEMCLRIHGNAHDFETEPFVQPCRRLGHGRVLDSGNDNARATICRLFAIGFGESATAASPVCAGAHGDAFVARLSDSVPPEVKITSSGRAPNAAANDARAASSARAAVLPGLVHAGRIGVGLSQERGHGLDDCRAHCSVAAASRYSSPGSPDALGVSAMTSSNPIRGRCCAQSG